MKIWNKIKHPLAIALILMGFTALRIAVPAMPYDWRFLLYFRFIISIFSGEWFGSNWMLWDLALFLATVCCIMAVPFLRKLGKAMRFAICTLLTLAVFLACTPLVNNTVTYAQTAYKEHQDRQYDAMVDAHHQEIRDFIAIADEAVWYSYNNYGCKEEFPELVRQVWAGNNMPHVTNTILIDYDSKTVGFAYHDISYFVLKDIPLTDGFTVPDTCDLTNTAFLAESGAKLTMYFNYTNGQIGNGYDIVCIALTMADGTVYGTNHLTDPENGRNYRLRLPISDEGFVRIEDFLERKEND